MRLSVRDNTSSTNNAIESFHAALRRRIKTAHAKLFAFLGHLQERGKGPGVICIGTSFLPLPPLERFG